MLCARVVREGVGYEVATRGPRRLGHLSHHFGPSLRVGVVFAGEQASGLRVRFGTPATARVFSARPDTQALVCHTPIIATILRICKYQRFQPPLDSPAVLSDAAGVSYPGSKNGSGVYQAIINRMPPHQVYLEPFLGGGAILRLKRPAALNIGVDLDKQVIDGWTRWSELASPTGQAGSGGAPGRICGNGDARSIIVASGVRRRRGAPDLAGAAETSVSGAGTLSPDRR